MNTLEQPLSFEDLPKAVKQILSDVSQIKTQLSKSQNPQKEEIEYYTTEETLKVLGIKRTALWNYCKQGKLTPKGSGKRRFYSKTDVISFMENNGFVNK